jgi:hypothetical protein
METITSVLDILCVIHSQNLQLMISKTMTDTKYYTLFFFISTIKHQLRHYLNEKIDSKIYIQSIKYYLNVNITLA